MKRRLILICCFVLSLLITGRALAHHGTAISYDLAKTVTLSGTVTKFAFSNPHSQVYFDVKDEKGEVVHWAAELNAPGVLAKGGWTRKTIVPGDQITIIVNPSKSGTPVGNAVRSKPIIANGRELLLGGRDIE